ncbi:hypothetical protein M427DRAFT_52614 [Gonapodya prolifera JEL478]|uniref:Uncharacterized protein n=1 Tax=Gonapodya prolifera (strain JEL478) TaxID=1344416 RepID=A0A139AT47_GONPJ|nr:hypothetical protein M427DRAFT_52614 [Gonapodya prolifera JEL478]|eukprot:KXS19733.1 hypothetical protein M427DRAFT_52614 [Gonapodya prolifera JEL478]
MTQTESGGFNAGKLPPPVVARILAFAVPHNVSFPDYASLNALRFVSKTWRTAAQWLLIRRIKPAGIVCAVTEELDPRVFDSDEQKHIWTVWLQFQDPSDHFRSPSPGIIAHPQPPPILPPTVRFGAGTEPPVVIPHGLHPPTMTADPFIRAVLKSVDVDKNGGFPFGGNGIGAVDSVGSTMMVPSFARDDKVRGLVVEEVYLVTRVDGFHADSDKGKGVRDRSNRNYEWRELSRLSHSTPPGPHTPRILGSYLGHSRLSSATPNTPSSSVPRSTVSARACFLGSRSDWVLEVKHQLRPRPSQFGFLSNTSTVSPSIDEDDINGQDTLVDNVDALPPTPADDSRDTIVVRFIGLECTYGFLCGGVRSPERVGASIVSQMRAAATSDDLFARMVNTERARAALGESLQSSTTPPKHLVDLLAVQHPSRCSHTIFAARQGFHPPLAQSQRHICDASEVLREWLQSGGGYRPDARSWDRTAPPEIEASGSSDGRPVQSNLRLSPTLVSAIAKLAKSRIKPPSEAELACVLSMIGATLVKPLSYGGAAWLDIEDEQPNSVLDDVGTWLGGIFGGVASRKNVKELQGDSWW